MTDIEDKRTPVIGVTLQSSTELAEASYIVGWQAAIEAVVTMMDRQRAPTSLIRDVTAIPFEPSESIEKMKAALK